MCTKTNLVLLALLLTALGTQAEYGQRFKRDPTYSAQTQDVARGMTNAINGLFKVSDLVQKIQERDS